MKVNENHKVENETIILVPYCEMHVDKYHRWMQSPELQELTASIPLTLDEEYEMQKSWHLDKDKCTFLILDKETYNLSNHEVDAMIGDTNIFVKNNETGVAEIELMIAEPSFRSKKRGWNSIIAMLRYGIENLDITSYFVKIGANNFPSVSLFKKLKFKQDGCLDVFEEFTFKVTVDEEWVKWLNNQSPNYRISPYVE